MTDDLLTQIRTLSNGTLATLSGLCRYQELDTLRETWLKWALCQPSRKMDWQESWVAFALSSTLCRCDYPLDGMGAASASKRRASGQSSAPHRCNKVSTGHAENGFRFCHEHAPDA